MAICGDFLDRGLALAETTIANYRHYFALFAEFIGDKEMEAITSRAITRFSTHLERGRNLSGRSLQDVLSKLSPEGDT